MKNRSIWLIAGLSVTVPILLGAGFLLYRGVARYNQAEEKLKSAMKDRDRICARAPSFPSDENIALEKKNIEELGGLYDDLNEKLAKGQIEPDEQMTPARFTDLFWKTKAELMRKASEKSVTIEAEEKIAFGFEQYIEGRLPQPNDVPRLSQQLRIVKAMCDLLFDAGITELQLVKRERFERTARSNTGGRARRATKDEFWNQDAGLMKEGELAAKMKFVFTFKALEKPLVKILNDMATHEMFVAPYSISLTALMPETMHNEEPIYKVFAAEGKKPLLEDIPHPDNRVVSGVEKPMQVLLGVEVYRFRKADAE